MAFQSVKLGQHSAHVHDLLARPTFLTQISDWLIVTWHKSLWPDTNFCDLAQISDWLILSWHKSLTWHKISVTWHKISDWLTTFSIESMGEFSLCDSSSWIIHIAHFLFVLCCTLEGTFSENAKKIVSCHRTHFYATSFRNVKQVAHLYTYMYRRPRVNKRFYCTEDWKYFFLPKMKHGSCGKFLQNKLHKIGYTRVNFLLRVKKSFQKISKERKTQLEQVRSCDSVYDVTMQTITNFCSPTKHQVADCS